MTLDRSRREIEAAQLLVERAFGSQAISRACYAAVYTAEHTLGSLAESRSKHSGVIAAFGKLVVREGGLDEEYGRILRSLFEQRNHVDYGDAMASRQDAERAVGDAQSLVNAAESWAAERQKSGRSAAPTAPRHNERTGSDDD